MPTKKQPANFNQSQELSPTEQWAYSTLTQNEADSLRNLSQFGLKNETDVIRFLKSPEGKNVLAELNLQLQIEQQIQRNQQLSIEEQNLASHRLKAALFLWFIKEKVHADTIQKEIIIQQGTKAISETGKIPDALKASVTPYRQILQNANLDYIQAHEINEEFSKINAEEELLLLNEMKALQEFATEIELKYSVFINELDNMVFTEFNLDTINAQIDEKRAKIDQHIVDNEDDEASKLMRELIILFAKIDSFKDYQAVNNKTKFYVDETGAEVDSSKAFFILDVLNTPDPNNPQQFLALKPQIIKDQNGNYYLLKPGQKWEDVEKNPALKEQARKDFELQKPNLLVTKQAVLQNKVFEVQDNSARTAQQQLKMYENQAVKLELHNQNLMLTAALSQIKAALDNPNLTENNSLRPMPLPTANASGPKPNLSVASVKAAQYYKDQLVLLRKHSINYDNVLNLRNDLYLRGDTPRVTALNFQLQNIPRRGPIPFLTMQTLIRNLELIGVDPTNPAVTSLKNPLDLALNPADKPTNTPPAPKPAVEVQDEPEPEVSYKRPTPFKTNPFE